MHISVATQTLASRPNILSGALRYAARGVPVFACDGAKKPIVRGGFKAATTDEAEIWRMFALPAAALIGIPTGVVGRVDALDIDPRHGGNDWLAANMQHLPDTRTHRTPSGGRHLLFLADRHIRCSAGRIAPGIDVRAEGGYIIAPPSPGYAIINAAPVAPWPEWLLPLAVPREPISRPATSPPQPIGSGRVRAYVARLLRTVSDAADGQKHYTLFRCGRALGGVLHLAEMPHGEAVDALLAALPPTVNDWKAARATACAAVKAGMAVPIDLADRRSESRRYG